MTGMISLAMIVRNEEELLSTCLDSVTDAVDEIVIVDTGSVDKTMEIAGRYTNKIYSYSWQGDFSAARNYAIDQCTCQWILYLDADERLEGEPKSLRELVNATTKEAFILPIKNYAGPGYSDYNVIGILRLFRNLPHYRFIGKIHEQIGIADQKAVGHSDYPVISHSYVHPRRRRDKRRRNINLLTEQLKREPEIEAFSQYYLGCEWLGLERYQQAYTCFCYAYEQLDENHIYFRSNAVRSLVACLRCMGRLEEALAICIRETARYPEYTDLFFDCGVVLEQMGEYDVAVRWFKAATDLGLPPMVYQHSNGTEDFLSQYHLGHCCQTLGKYEEAAQWYEKALQTNKVFIYPLYGLFMVLVTQEGCEELLNYFIGRGYAASYQSKQALGALFFTSGRPDLSVKICCQAESFGTPSDELAKYLLYSSNFKQAVNMTEELQRRQNVDTVEIRKLEILGYIFLNDLPTAKARCLTMWRCEHWRAEAMALLAIIKRLQGNRLGVSSNFEQGFVDSLLKVIADCERSYGENSHVFTQVAKCCAEIISDLEQGSKALLSFWQSEIKGIEMLLDIRYKSVRGLYVWKKDGR